METAGDGSTTQPVLSVAIRDNTPFARLSAETTSDSASREVNGDKSGVIGRGESGGEAVEPGENINRSVERSALLRSVRIGGSTKMLDLVTESPPGCTVNECLISEPPCNVSGSSSNGFTGANQADTGGTAAYCPAPGTGDMNDQGRSLQALSLSEQTHVCVDEPRVLNYETMPHTVDYSLARSSHKGQQENSSAHPAVAPRSGPPEGLLNGDVHGVPQVPAGDHVGSRSRTERYTTAVAGPKMSNGGLGRCHSAREESPSLPGGDTCVSLSYLQNSSTSSTARGSLCQDSGTTGEPGRTGPRSRTQENMMGEQLSRGDGSSHTSQGSSLSPGQTTHLNTELDPPTTRQTEVDHASGLGLSGCEPSPGLRPVLSSVGYDCSPISPGDGAAAKEAQCGPSFMDVNLNSRNTYESSRRQSAPGHLPPGPGMVDPSEQALQSKRPGIAEYFGRSLFSKRQREHSAPGWKLFGKVPLRESPSRDSRTIQQESVSGSLTSVSTPDLLNPGEYEAKLAKPGNSPTQNAQGRRKNLEFEPLSTTALILEDRPANLPAKSAEEAQRHRQEYEEMVAEAKKRELREAQRKQKQMKERIRQEESIANAMLVWNNDILPHWDSTRNSRRARDLWWQGLPPNVRGRVWSLAIGNELNITPELYEIFLSRAREKWRIFSETGSESEADDGASLADRESSLDLIKLDISRTFPPLFIFQKGGPYHDVLHSVLGAYTCYRPDVGYVQGMSFIAAVLILNLEEADAFIAFANLLNKPCQLAFFRVDHDLMLKYFAAFEVFFEENLPRLFNHFQSYNLTPDLYLIDWIFTLYSKSLPLDVACRVWDVFCRDGEEFLFQTGLGILRLYDDVLLQMDFIHIAQFLARLPEDMLSDRLFSCIAATPMVSGNRKWMQVFNALIKDNNKEMDKNTSPALKS